MRSLVLVSLVAILTLSIGVALFSDAEVASQYIESNKPSPDSIVTPEPPSALLEEIQEAQAEADSTLAQASNLNLPPTDLLFDSSTGDWAERAPIPPWVLSPDAKLVTASSVKREARQDDVVEKERRDLSSSLMLAIRVQGNSVVLDDIGLNDHPIDLDDLKVAGSLHILGDCQRRVAIRGKSVGAPTYLRVDAREVGRIGDWLYALVGAESVCGRATRRMYPKKTPTQAERLGLINAFTLAPAELAPPAGVFRTSDIREFAVSGAAGDNTRYAFGVARTPSKTQLAPAPPWPQFAFIAEGDGDGRWRLVWSSFIDAPRSRVGLAGVYDTDGDRIAEALFVFRLADRAELVRVALSENGVWQEVDRIPLAKIP